MDATREDHRRRQRRRGRVNVRGKSGERVGAKGVQRWRDETLALQNGVRHVNSRLGRCRRPEGNKRCNTASRVRQVHARSTQQRSLRTRAGCHLRGASKRLEMRGVAGAVARRMVSDANRGDRSGR